MDDDQKKCGGITIGGILLLSWAIAMIIIGAININFDNSNLESPEKVDSSCNVEPRIPYWLLVFGILAILIAVIHIIFQRCCKSCGEGCEDNKLCNTINHVCKFSCTTFIDILLLVAFCIWLSVGTAWVFDKWNEVTYNNEGAGSYCPKYLYGFSAASVITGWLSVVLFILCGLLGRFCSCFWGLLCCKPCKEADGQAV